jgi:hypothetical protein
MRVRANPTLPVWRDALAHRDRHRIPLRAPNFESRSFATSLHRDLLSRIGCITAPSRESLLRVAPHCVWAPTPRTIPRKCPASLLAGAVALTAATTKLGYTEISDGRGGQGGVYGEHQLVSVTSDGQTRPIGSPVLTMRLEPGCGQRLVLTMRRYANAPTVMHPWHAGRRAKTV